MNIPSPAFAMAAIATADIYEIEAPLVHPYKLSEGTISTSRAVMIKLTDADGVEGWGEANPNKSFSGEAPQEAASALKSIMVPHVLSLATPNPGQVDADLDAAVERQLFAKGAITMALLDLLGKRLNVPVSTLLGGARRTELPVLWPLSNGSVDEDIPVIDEKIEEGYSSFMLKMGTSPISDEIARVARLEQRYGSRIALIADANQGWSREQAMEFLTGVRGSNLAFVEQPLERDDLEGMAMLARSTKLAISADESVKGLAEAGRIATMGAASIFSIKSSKNGGPLRAQRIAAVAQAFGIKCYMNSMIEFGITQAASLQHAVTLGNLVEAGHAFMSTLRLAEDPTDFSSLVNGGKVRMPTGAGLGINVDEAHVRRLAVDHVRLTR